MFLLRRPSRRAIESFLDASRETRLSYAPVGIVESPPVGYDVDECVLTIGHGQAAFQRATGALAAWKHFDVGWVELSPAAPAVEPGTVVTLLIHHLGFWSLNGCRVVWRWGDRDGGDRHRDGGDRFGFTYGTLLNHAEQGEELFEVALDCTSGDVTYRIRAVSRPRAPLARFGYPVVRGLQARFRRDSAEAMRRAVAG